MSLSVLRNVPGVLRNVLSGLTNVHGVLHNVLMSMVQNAIGKSLETSITGEGL